MGVFCQIVYDLLLELVIGEDEEESEKEKRKVRKHTEGRGMYTSEMES